jgi:hypothetical protein
MNMVADEIPNYSASDDQLHCSTRPKATTLSAAVLDSVAIILIVVATTYFLKSFSQ